MSTKPNASRVRSAYEFIKAHRAEYRVQMMCRVLDVAPSGYYEWLRQPVSNRGQEDARLLRLIRTSFTASRGIYGAPRVFLDSREAGETCSKHRVARLMRQVTSRVYSHWLPDKSLEKLVDVLDDTAPRGTQTAPAASVGALQKVVSGLESVVSRVGIEPTTRRLRERRGGVHWMPPFRFCSENQRFPVRSLP